MGSLDLNINIRALLLGHTNTFAYVEITTQRVPYLNVYKKIKYTNLYNYSTTVLFRQLVVRG